MPVGPWLLVVGMHRSGTSAVTGALAQLGLAAPFDEDRWEPSEDNPDHWESKALALHDDVLLERLGGTWDRPPDPGWELSPDDTFSGPDDPAVPAGEAFPLEGPVVWKDPRVCLLLPYWLRHIPQPVAAVFIWRSPLAVARSLQARDGLHLADGLALWERYNRSGLAGLAGVDTFVTQYESIVEDPSGGLGKLATWLAGLPQFARYSSTWDVDSAVNSVSPKLARQHASGDSELLLPEQVRLVEHLESLDGPHHPLAGAAPGTESPWTTAVLGDRHQLAALSIQRDALKERVRQQGYAAQALEAEVSARSNEVDLAKGALADAQAMVLEAQVRVHEAEARVSEAEARVSEAETRVSEAEVEVSEAHEQNERLKASTSWRITRPIRQIAALRTRRSIWPGT
jgi:hypothetical protein